MDGNGREQVDEDGKVKLSQKHYSLLGNLWGVNFTVVEYSIENKSKVEFIFKIEVETGKISTTFDRIFDYH